MADSRNTTNLSRRSILGTGIAAAGALAVTALPAMAVQQSDRRLLLLCHQYRRFSRISERLCDRQEEAELKDRARKARPRRQKLVPPRPEALTGQLDVWPEAAGPFGLIDLEDKDARKVLGELADGTHRLHAIFMPRATVPADVTSIPPPDHMRAKARELIAVYDDWVRRGGGDPKPTRQRRSSALVKIEKAFERLHQLERSTGLAIAALPAATMAGVRAKLDLIYADAWSADEHFGTDYPPLIAVLNSAMRDIARIQIGARLNPPSLKDILVASLQQHHMGQPVK
jgi:hypothetical protein